MNTPGSWARVVLASELLPSGGKLVWLQLATLDRGPERAYVSASGLARRLGMGRDNVENLRRDLRAYGLLESGPRPGKRAVTWWPALPAPCRPRSERPTDDDVVELAQVLDGFIRNARGVPQSADPPPTNGVPQSAARSVAIGVSQSAASRTNGGPEYAKGGGKGEGASCFQAVEKSHPTSSHPVVMSEEVGAFAREQSKDGEAGNPVELGCELFGRRRPDVRPATAEELERKRREYREAAAISRGGTR